MAYILKNVINSPIKNLSDLTVSSDYGNRSFSKPDNEVINDYHDGIDITSGNEIVAVENGVVEKAENNVQGYNEKQASGNYVLLRHDNNIKTIYAHMKKDSVIPKAGDVVSKGDVLGQMGNTGYVTGKHLHFAVNENGIWVDPKDYLLGKKVFSEDQKEEYFIHKVKKGETLSEISQKYKVSQDSVVALNSIKNPNLIFIGSELKIPFINTYVVQKGDNLSKIAKMYNTTWQKIYEKNKKTIGSDPNKIIPGQILNI